MKIKAAVLAMLSALVLTAPLHSFADTLQLVSTGGQNVGGEDVYPYNMSVNGSPTLTSLMCLNLNRFISFGETWNVNVSSVPLDSSQTSIDYRADAWIFSQLGASSNSDVQYAVWDIFDPQDAGGNSGFTAASQSLVQTGFAMAQNSELINSGFFSNFSLYLPTDDQTGWTNGQPQSFIGTAQTPEPSTLMLLGTGLIGATGAVRRRFAKI